MMSTDMVLLRPYGMQMQKFFQISRGGRPGGCFEIRDGTTWDNPKLHHFY